mgnify:CR=1 FL=1
MVLVGTSCGMVTKNLWQTNAENPVEGITHDGPIRAIALDLDRLQLGQSDAALAHIFTGTVGIARLARLFAL